MFGRHPAVSGPVQERLPATDPAVPSRSCCCPARPVVKVIMPPTQGRRHSVDLWLCGHHYRASRAALLTAGARVEELARPAGSDIELLARVA
jgi:hypothetical protein